MKGGSGKPCGGSFISASYKCRVGGGSYNLTAFSEGDQKIISAALEKYEAAMEANIPPEAQKMWSQAARNCVKEHEKYKKSSDRIPKEGYGNHLARQLEKAEEMMVNQPRYLRVLDKTFEAPPGLEPYFEWSQVGWKERVAGVSYSAPNKQGVSEPKKQSGGASWAQVHIAGHAAKALEFRKEREAQNLPWPMLPTVTVTPEDVQKLLKAEGPDNRLWTAGGNILDTNPNHPRKELLEYYKIKDKVPPSEEVSLRRKNKEAAIVESWLMYGKLDPISGEPIDLPNRPGSTVDHKVPFANIKKRTPDPFEAISLADRASNFYVTAGGLQGLRKDTPWEEWLDIKNTPNLDQDAWYAGLSKNEQKNPPIMALSRKQFEERYKTLDYDNPADRRVAAMYGRRDLMGVYSGGSVGTIAMPKAPAPRKKEVKPRVTARKQKAPAKPASTPKPAPKKEVTAEAKAEALANLNERLAAAKKDRASALIKTLENMISKLQA